MEALNFKVVDFATQLAVILFAISFHESAHAYAALRFGDTTARDLGRISLNPIRHIDPIGSVLLPLFLYFTSGLLFGYAKPTPVDLRNTSNPRLADLVVSAAGPLSNLFLSTVGLIGVVAVKVVAPGSMRALVDALQGQRFGQGAAAPVAYLLFQFALVNFQLGIFNLVPIPPLDGSWVLASVFGEPVRRFFQEFGRFGFIVLILLSSTRFLSLLLRPFLEVFFALANRAIS